MSHTNPPTSPTPPSIDTFNELMDTIWRRALDMTSEDFKDDADYLKAQTNYRNYSKSQLLTLFESVIMEVIGEDVPHTDSHVFKCATLKEDTDMYANKCNCGKADKLLLIAQQRTKAAAALARLRNG